MKKYPFTYFMLLGVLNIFCALTAWRFIDYYARNSVSKAFFPVYLGLSSIVMVLILVLFGDKLLKKEEKTRDRNFKKRIRSNKPIVLVIKRQIFANFSLIFSLLLIWVFFVLLFPSKEFSGTGYTAVRIIGVLWFAYGLTFSLIIQKKLVVFENKEFTIIHNGGVCTVKPQEIAKISLKTKTNEINIKEFLLADVTIELINGENLVCVKADRVVGCLGKIKIIQKFYSKTL